MHNYHYGNLHFALSSYCQLPGYSYGTRYSSEGNYVLPNTHTNRDQTSIKYAGPKAWYDVPNEFKEVAFRKPFSKKMKEHLVNIIVSKSEGKPLITYRKFNNDNNLEDLAALAEIFYHSDDEDDEFLGFDVCNLRAIFNDDDNDQDEEFFGFNVCNLRAIFNDDDSDQGEFLGFDVHPSLETLFDSGNESEGEFLGFPHH